MPADFLHNALLNKCYGSPQTRFAINMTAGVINAATDLILTAIPLTLIRKAAMPYPAKVSACLVLLVGCTGSAVSLVRLAYLQGLNYSKNFFEGGFSITIWSVIEAGLCITAASLATLRPLFHCCIGTTRRSIASKTYTARGDIDSAHFTELKSPGRHRLSGFTIRAQEIKEIQVTPPIRPRRPSATAPKPQEMDDLVPVSGITRKASIQRGRVQWLDPRVATPSPPPPRRLRKPSRSKIPHISSGGHGDERGQASLISAATPRQALVARASRDKPLPSVPNATQPRMEEVGVGAWRVLDKAP